MLKTYLDRILVTARLGDAREESYYSALEALLSEFAHSTNKKDAHVTTLPKKTDAGNPDFRIWDGKRRIIGYIEAKTPDKNLDDIEKTEQIKRYTTTFPNFILTNFFEFRLYKHGSCVSNVRIADPIAVHTLRGTPFVGADEEFENLLEKFFSFSLPSITSTETLAVELAKRTRFLRDEVIAEEIEEEEKSGMKKILGFYEAFQTYLIRGLTKEQFADLYSQTITYGLFASRMRSEGEFNRRVAVDDIPHTIGILREMFNFISLGDLPPQLEWIVDEISDVLANVDVKGIFSEYFKNKRGGDPVFPFYETFLAEYDPEEREKRGVYYTPEPVVSYIVRSLDVILNEKFGLKDGLAHKDVTVLDPAGGTLTFLAEAIKQAEKRFTSKYGDGGKESFAREHILADFYAFELLVAPYTIGHLKISFILEELGYKLQKDERLKFYLTNTLEMEDIEQTSLPGMASLSEESHLAGIVKKQTPILVILGNPPYSGHSTNVGDWISKEIKEYYTVDGEPLAEKNPKWLQDDYVKFIRFAQWKIDQIGEGVLGYITNHSYLDNPTFRGMRQSLMRSFNEIYLLDLHGNSLKKEKCPDGSKDENVFDIRQGVAIGFFVRRKGNGSNGDRRRVFHSELWGMREKKYEWLNSHDIKTTEWKEIQPTSPFYFFVPREEKHGELYSRYWKITDIFLVNSVGIVTARDKLTVGDTLDQVWKVIQDFASLSEDEARIKYDLGKDAQDWKVSLAQKDLATSGLKRELIIPILYRPFDVRYTYYTGHSRGFICRPRQEVMKHMLKENMAICVGRAGQVVGLEKPWNIVFCSVFIPDFNLFYRGGNVNFPLYTYRNQDRTPNINASLLASLQDAFGSKPSPEEVFYYIYSIMYSNIYRKKYAEFLQTDFPKVPITKEQSLFRDIAKLGKRLVELHLMKSDELAAPLVKFQGGGDNTVESPEFKNENQVFINKTQYFLGIERNVWEYQIGGYQVLNKWIKDRMGRRLSLEDIKHFCRVATALRKTMEIQKEIDLLYSDVEKTIIDFKPKDKHSDLKHFTQEN
jgi:hypothetical protein